MMERRRRLGMRRALRSVLGALLIVTVGIGAQQPAAGTAAAGTAAAGTAVTPAAGAFHPLDPARIFDTRTGLGGTAAPIGPGQVATIQVTGQGGVPDTGVAAVVMNVTAVSPSAASYLTVYPAGATRPLASNLNYIAGQTVPNLVQVAVGTGGRVEAFNALGAVHVVVDVAGWVAEAAEAGTAGLFKPLPPARVLDTRIGQGGAVVGAGQTIDVQVAGAGGVPATGASAVALNLTVTDPTAASYVTAYPTGQPQPLASNLNFAPGDTVPNRVIVRLGEAGKVSLFNHSGSAQLIADVAGWYTDGSDDEAFGAAFTGLVPSRFIDTRSTAPVAGGASLRVPVAGRAGIPGMDAEQPPTAVVANLTVTEPTAAGYLTAFPGDQTRPLASDLNFVPGTTRPNLAIVKLGPDGSVEIFNSDGASHVIVDVLGWYAGDVVVKEQLKVLDPAALAALQEVTPTGLVFSSAAGTVASLQVGDVVNAGLSAKTPEGLLRKVTGIATVGSTVQVATEQAALADALGQGGFAETTPISTATFLRFEAAGEGTTVAPTPSATPKAEAAAIGVSGGLRVSFSRTHEDASKTWSLTTAGVLDFSGSAKIWADVGFFDLNAGMDVKAAQSLSLTVSGEGTAAGLEIEVLLGRIYLAPIVIPVGPVIVVVIPRIDLKLAAEGTISVSMSGSLQQTASASAGVQYDDGFSTYKDSDFDVLGWNFEGPEVGLKLKAGPVVDYRSDIYGIAGPDVAIKPYVSYEMEPCKETLSAGIDAVIGFKGKIWKFDLADWDTKINVYAALLHEETRGDCGQGDVQVSLLWSGSSDLDLHVIEPSGEEIAYYSPVSSTGGTLDVDVIPDEDETGQHIENVFWPEGQAPVGSYTAFVHHYGSWTGAPASYSMQVKVNGVIIHSETGTLAYDAVSAAYSFSVSGLKTTAATASTAGARAGRTSRASLPPKR
jgi:hypothetical protein